MIRVLIADDHAVVRQGLRSFLDLQDDIQVVGEASDGAEALAAAERLAPDVVLIDLVMPNVDGIEAIRGLREHVPAARAIVRLPLAEVRFFSIVIAIQQQAGGNLSEALGNLSGVLRDRKRLQAKVRALSAEAKASAAVLGALPFIVMILVYITTPAYISILWTTKFGQFLLAMSGCWMTIGILVMRKMINFKY